MVHVSGQGGVHGHTGAVPRRAGRAVRPVTDRHGLQRPRTRARRTNAAFRQLVGLPDEAIIGRQPSEAEVGFDGALVERALAEQVISRGVPLIDMYVEQTVAGERRVFSWSAYRVTDNGQVLGALGLLVDVTGRVQAVTALRQANARLDLLERAGSQIGATLDCHRTAGELAALAVPEVADRIVIDLLDEVLQGESPPRPGSGILRFRRVAVRDAKTGAKIGYKVGDLITAPQLGGVVAAHGDEAGATCLYAAYDPASRRCRLTSAGHLPPALRRPGGRVEFLAALRSSALGSQRVQIRSFCLVQPVVLPGFTVRSMGREGCRPDGPSRMRREALCRACGVPPMRGGAVPSLVSCE